MSKFKFQLDVCQLFVTRKLQEDKLSKHPLRTACLRLGYKLKPQLKFIQKLTGTWANWVTKVLCQTCTKLMTLPLDILWTALTFWQPHICLERHSQLLTMHSPTTEMRSSWNLLQTGVAAGVRCKPDTVRYSCLYWIRSCIAYIVEQSVRLLQGGRPTDDSEYLFSFSCLQLNASMATGFHKQKGPLPSLYC